MIINELAIVESTEKIAYNTYRTFIRSPKISVNIKPGQFVNILPSKSWNMMMRRPMSVASQDGEVISIIYKVVGDGTRIMKNWQIGEEIDLLGPLGNHWDISIDKQSILIGGGVGIAPIINLFDSLHESGNDKFLIMGARNKDEHFINHDPNNNIYLTTDDGSLGIHGNVLIPLKNILESINPNSIKIFTCGPPAMMDAIRKFSISEKIECDLALETIMACGFGICQGCTVEYNSTKIFQHSYRNRYGLVCIDGPIFKAKDVKSCHI